MLLSVRGYAKYRTERYRKVSHVYVLRMLAEGRITAEPDGRIDPEKADAEWDRNVAAADHAPPRRPPAAPPAVDSAPALPGGVSLGRPRRHTSL